MFCCVSYMMGSIERSRLHSLARPNPILRVGPRETISCMCLFCREHVVPSIV